MLYTPWLLSHATPRQQGRATPTSWEDGTQGHLSSAHALPKPKKVDQAALGTPLRQVLGGSRTLL